MVAFLSNKYYWQAMEVMAFLSNKYYRQAMEATYNVSWTESKEFQILGVVSTSLWKNIFNLDVSLITVRFLQESRYKIPNPNVRITK